MFLTKVLNEGVEDFCRPWPKVTIEENLCYISLISKYEIKEGSFKNK